MLLDDTLIAASIKDRKAFVTAADVIDVKQLNENASRVWKVLVGFYGSDPAVQEIDRETLKAKLKADAPTDKVGDVLAHYVDGLSLTVSSINVIETCRAIKGRRLRLDIADALLGEKDDAQDLIQAYMQFLAGPVTEEREPDQMTLEDLCNGTTKKIKVHPPAFNEALGGGLNRGETVLFFGRPGSAKTAAAVNVAGGLANQGLLVAYGCNEESKRKITLRFLSLLGGVSLDDMQHADEEISRKHIAAAVERASTRGMKNVYIRHGMMSWANMQAMIDELKPDVVVLDQLRNVRGGGYEGNMHSDMEAVQRAMRMSAVTNDFIGITVAQAGASADGKEILGESDIDGAKTGPQGAVDVIVGVGVTPELRAAGKRVWNICRNKVNGIIKNFTVFIDEQYTRVK